MHRKGGWSGRERETAELWNTNQQIKNKLKRFKTKQK